MDQSRASSGRSTTGRSHPHTIGVETGAKRICTPGAASSQATPRLVCQARYRTPITNRISTAHRPVMKKKLSQYESAKFAGAALFTEFAAKRKTPGTRTGEYSAV